MPYCNICGDEIEFRYVNSRAVPIHLNGNYCRGYSSKITSTRRIDEPFNYEWIYPNIRKIVDYPSYVNPNVECHCCGKLIHFYQSPYGGQVFFESPLGPPWTKHCCNPDKGCCEKQKDSPKRNFSSSENQLSLDWQVYFVISIKNFRMITKLKKIILKSLSDEKLYTFFIHKEIDIKDGSLGFIKKLCPKYGEFSFYKKDSPVRGILISEEQNTRMYYSKAKKYFPKLFFSFKRYPKKMK